MTPLEQILLAKQEKKFAEDEVMDRLELAVAVANNTISPAEARKALKLSSSGQIYTMLGLAIMSAARKGLCNVTITGERYPEEETTDNLMRTSNAAESPSELDSEQQEDEHPWAKPILEWIQTQENIWAGSIYNNPFSFSISDLLKVMNAEDSRSRRIMIGGILSRTRQFERFRGPRSNRSGRGAWMYRRIACAR